MNSTFIRLHARCYQSARWLLGLGLTLLTVATFAQTAGTISGTVADPESGQGLPGVNVVSKGSSRGTTTDGNGRYQLTGILRLQFWFSAPLAIHRRKLRWVTRPSLT